MAVGWIIVAALTLVTIFSFCGGGAYISPWYNTLSDNEKENYSKSKISFFMSIYLAIFTILLALFVWFLSFSVSDTIQITVSIVYFLFIVFYLVIIHKIGLKNCKKK